MKSKETTDKNKLEYLNWALQLGSLAVVWLMIWGGKFSKEVREYALSIENKTCVNCGSDSSLEAHHMCYEGIAKKYGVEPKFYNHPANATILCTSCHDTVHDSDPLATQAEEWEMIMALYERIIVFHTTGKEEEARWINRGRQLSTLANSEVILREASQRLAEMRAEVEGKHGHVSSKKKKLKRKKRKTHKRDNGTFWK